MKGDESEVENRDPVGNNEVVQAKPHEPIAPHGDPHVEPAQRAGDADRDTGEQSPQVASGAADESGTATSEQGDAASPARDDRRRGEGRRDGFRVRGGRDANNRQGRRGGENSRGRGRSQEPQDDDHDDEESFTHEGAESVEQDDPLAGAFDLERGTPINPIDGYSERDNLPARAKVKSAKEFFSTEILYRFDILEDEDRTELKGSYRLELKGYQGGVWTVSLGDALEVVNRREEAEIVLTMQQRDFVTLVNGQLNPQLAIFAQKMRVSGDVKKAILFQNLLCPTTD